MKKFVAIGISAFTISVALASCSGMYSPGMASPQEKLDNGVVACRQGKRFLFVTNSGYSSSWVQLIGDDGRPERC